ncbi:universal stress protein [Halobellus rubicundus]|uniref:Universal stress protein n=1 Tax=Halobellus rubicundus TaxID=2996466 RepID=A0ABD5M7U8_9EURY
MFDDVLFPTDGSGGAARVLDHVLDLAEAHDATLHILSAAQTDSDALTRGREDIAAEIESRARAAVDTAADRAADRGVETVRAVETAAPADAIVAYAASGGDDGDGGVDLIAMPTHGRTGIERLLLGSTTERVVRRSPAPVLAVGPDEERELAYPYERVLAPTDGSACADVAVGLGADLAAATDARLDVLSVVDVAHLGLDARVDLQIDQLEANAEQFVESGVDLASDAGVAEEAITSEVVTGTSAHREINKYVSEHDVDLIVVGTHGRTGVDRYLLGSVTEKLLRTASVPVLTVRRPADETEGN